MESKKNSEPKEFDFESAALLPKNIYFGTSTWTYPGWKNIIYHREYKSEREFNRRSLEEYAKFPWFRSVGIDSTFYAPPKESLLREYASQLPEDFLWVSKVWERVTVPKYPKHPRYGKSSGLMNEDFLNPMLFIDSVLKPYRDEEVRKHSGPFVFQFGHIQKDLLSADEFFKKLEGFLSAVPKEFQYAIEVRNSEFLNSDYFSVLNTQGATHCFNHWTSMPSLKAQMKAAASAGGLSAPFYVARILTPRGISYEQAVELFAPYDRLQRPNPEMREDVVRLAQRAIETKRSAFVIVNNRAEGHAPMTINDIGRRVVGEPKSREHV